MSYNRAGNQSNRSLRVSGHSDGRIVCTVIAAYAFAPAVDRNPDQARASEPWDRRRLQPSPGSTAKAGARHQRSGHVRDADSALSRAPLR